MALVFHYENGIRLHMKKKKPRRANIEALIVLLKLSSSVYSVNIQVCLVKIYYIEWVCWALTRTGWKQNICILRSGS